MGANVTLYNITMEENSSGGSGGAVTLRSLSNLFVNNCTFRGNKAASNGGVFQTS